jgi:hypothetical protein
MTQVAMGLGRVDGGERPAAPKVLAPGDGLKMVGTNAPPVAAKMVEIQPFRD